MPRSYASLAELRYGLGDETRAAVPPYVGVNADRIALTNLSITMTWQLDPALTSAVRLTCDWSVATSRCLGRIPDRSLPLSLLLVERPCDFPVQGAALVSQSQAPGVHRISFQDEGPVV